MWSMFATSFRPCSSQRAGTHKMQLTSVNAWNLKRASRPYSWSLGGSLTKLTPVSCDSMFRSHHSPQSRLFGLAWKGLELGVKGTDLGERGRLFISIVDKVELGLLLQSARTLDLGPVPRMSA